MPRKFSHLQRGAWRWLLPIVGAVVAALPQQARAQLSTGLPPQSPAPWQQIEILPTPYLWLPWTSLDVRPNNPRLGGASDTIGPGKLISHLTWVPFMGEVELRNGPFGVIADYIHAPVKSGISTRNILFNGAQAGMTLDTGGAMFLYRPIALPDQYVDVGAGFRAWGLDGQISLNEGLLPAAVVSNGLSWADPLIAARYHRELGNGFSATVYGDVGGFGVGAHIDWQVIGTIDYAWRPGVDLHTGFRSLNFNFSGPAAKFNTHMYGPIIAATFHF